MYICSKAMLVLPLVSLLIFCWSEFAAGQFGFEDEEAVDYKGRLIGSFNSYHHQVHGEVYAVDAYTLLIKDLIYDGNGKDTFFWAGASNRPGPQGFIVPDENGRTNVLKRYLNDELTLRLPEQKRVTDLKWFSVYDLSLHDVFGDLYIPEYFEPPSEQILGDLVGQHGLKASQIVVLDAKTIRLDDFSYDGTAGDSVHFWVGVGPQPQTKGHLVPDEQGYRAALRRYDNEQVQLTLPGKLTVFEVRWLSVFDKEANRDLGHIIIPDNLNIPPALVTIVEHDTSLPNCEMLHSRLLVAWSVFAPSITLQLAGQMEENEYMALGVSGEQGASKMIGSDVAVGYINGFLGYIDDYNLTAKAFCSGLTGAAKKGVCRDDEVGGKPGDNQLQSHSRRDGVTVITWRRTLANTADDGDLPISEDGPTSMVWAIGKLARKGRLLEPSFHHLYPKSHVAIDFNRKEPENNCVAFTSRSEMAMKNALMDDDQKKMKPWGPFRLFDPALRSFDARLGPSGDSERGYSAITGLPAAGMAWYINGYLIPELFLRRGLTYAFRVEGGNDPYQTGLYHPFVITDEPVGGFGRLSESGQREVRILAGVEFTRRGAPQTVAAGRLCLWRHAEQADRRLDIHFDTFERFRNSLKLECKEGEPAVLEVTPNNTWPDVVYYHSFTSPYMGWKIHIVDSFQHQRYLFSNAQHLAQSTVSLAIGMIGLNLAMLQIFT